MKTVKWLAVGFCVLLLGCGKSSKLAGLLPDPPAGWSADGGVTNLHAAGVTNVSVLLGDGTLGWSAYAPYDAILVTAGGPHVPPPLVEQLTPGGRLLMPLGVRGAQTLTLVERRSESPELRLTPLGAARFVPLLGEHGVDA